MVLDPTFSNTTFARKLGYSTPLAEITKVAPFLSSTFGVTRVFDTEFGTLAVYDVVPGANVPKSMSLSVRLLRVSSVGSGGLSVRTVRDLLMMIVSASSNRKRLYLYRVSGVATI